MRLPRSIDFFIFESIYKHFIIHKASQSSRLEWTPPYSNKEFKFSIGNKVVIYRIKGRAQIKQLKDMKQVENNENKGKASEEWKRMRRVENG